MNQDAGRLEGLDSSMPCGSLSSPGDAPQALASAHTVGPMSLPLMVERLRDQLTTEKLAERLDRMLKDMNTAVERREAKP